MDKCVISIFLVIFVGSSPVVVAQNKDNPPFNTPNTHNKPSPNPKKYKSDNKNLVYIIKKDTRKFLPDNKCFENVTKDMGFKYIAVPKGQPYYASEFERLLHNLGSKIIILFKNGPFWKIKIRKTYKKCKYSYGDTVG